MIKKKKDPVGPHQWKQNDERQETSIHIDEDSSSRFKSTDEKALLSTKILEEKESWLRYTVWSLEKGMGRKNYPRLTRKALKTFDQRFHSQSKDKKEKFHGVRGKRKT